MGMTRGGFGSKLHLVVDAGGLPLAFTLTKGNRNECPEFPALFEAAAAARRGGLPLRLAADKGYSSDAIRSMLWARGVEPVIPFRSTEHVADRPGLHAAAYRGRNVVERCVGKLKEMRRVATRYEKLGANYAAMVTLAMSVLYLRILA
jgi:transposase